jgi:hypothetical protein
MTMSLPQEKMLAMVELCEKWCQETVIQRRALRSVAGKLLHVTQVLPQLRLFLNRLLMVLRQDGDELRITADMHEDLLWLASNLPKFNYTAMIAEKVYVSTYMVLEGSYEIVISFLGARHIIHSARKQGLLSLEKIREILRDQCELLKGKTITVKNISAAHIGVLKNGKCKNLDVLAVARDIWYVTAKYDISFDFYI